MRPPGGAERPCLLASASRTTHDTRRGGARGSKHQLLPDPGPEHQHQQRQQRPIADSLERSQHRIALRAEHKPNHCDERDGEQLASHCCDQGPADRATHRNSNEAEGRAATRIAAAHDYSQRQDRKAIDQVDHERGVRAKPCLRRGRGRRNAPERARSDAQHEYGEDLKERAFARTSPGWSAIHDSCSNLALAIRNSSRSAQAPRLRLGQRFAAPVLGRSPRGDVYDDSSVRGSIGISLESLTLDITPDHPGSSSCG